MARVLLLVLAIVAVLGVFTDDTTWKHVAASSASIAAHGDCCPDTTPDAADCCDDDFGRCCAGGSIAVLSGSQPKPVLRPAPRSDKTTLGPDMLLLRANGPPPTPPPIA